MGGTTKELPFLTPIFAMFNIKTPTSSYVLCFTSTPINHKVFFLFFFFSCRIPVVLESHRSSRSYSPNISHMKDCTALKLGDAFCIFTFFHFPVSGLYVLHDRL